MMYSTAKSKIVVFPEKEEDIEKTNYYEKLLNEKEKKILSLMAEGMSNPEIGKVLKISQHTVKSYSTKIFEKLCAKDRTHAAVKAIREKIIK